jgi:V/A-type H+-transporting ATPase subunit E
MSKLNDILQEEVLSEVNQILAEADSRAEKLIAEAKSKASERVEAYRKKVEAELQAAIRGMKSSRELTLSIARTRAREHGINLVRERVLAALEKIPTKQNYGEILEALAEEAFKAVEAAETAAVHPDDQDKLSAWAKQKGLELTTDPALRLGVRITTPGGGQSVENSLPKRLERGWEMLLSGVVQRLWGEPESFSISEK